ncbi:hypothetical protein PROVRUST_05669 [Providencia rustigianii DSM 4541]|uniref:Uncharacterized protein n=1 Tax=Providencia rustigianii DSM 4541 TaxID=500637 RepID=D1P0K2_9GAMM|nr:hypothetical protein PROVRUST_05669 [Providencia rustigianii DSM 4541]
MWVILGCLTDSTSNKIAIRKLENKINKLANMILIYRKEWDLVKLWILITDSQ